MERLVFVFVFFLGWPACCDPAGRPRDPASLLCFQRLPAGQRRPTRCPCMLVSGHEASRSLFASDSSQENYIRYYISFVEKWPASEQLINVFGGLQTDDAQWGFNTWELRRLTCRYLSNPRLVNSYCRWTRKFMFSTEWTTMFMNCMQATWRHSNNEMWVKQLTWLWKCQVWTPQPTMKSMLQSSLMKYSINFSKRFFSLLTWHK